MAQRSPIPVETAARAPAGPAARSGDNLDPNAVAPATDRDLRPTRRGFGQPWQWRVVVAAVLAAVLGLVLLVRTLTALPYVDVVWRTNANGEARLFASDLPALRGLEGASLRTIVDNRGASLDLDDMSLLRSTRWTVRLEERQAQAPRAQLAPIAGEGSLKLVFVDGREALVEPAPRGMAGLGALFWLLCVVSLTLYTVGVAVVVARPRLRNVLYLVMCFSQAANLLVIALECLPGMALPMGLGGAPLLARVSFDLITAAAAVHIVTIQPLRLPWGKVIAATTWAALALLATAIGSGFIASAFWWIQAVVLGCGGLVIALLVWSYRIEPNPMAVLMRHFSTMAVATLALLTVAVAVASRHGSLAGGVSSIGPVVWYLFMASLLIQLPFISRTQRLMREFAMLVGISTVTTSLYLLIQSIVAIDPLASLALSVFLALAAYIGIRQWLFSQVSGGSMLSAERLFERLYRVLREVEARPQDSADLLLRLLHELFEPMEARPVPRTAQRSRVFGDGSIMVVPVPFLGASSPGQPDTSILLRFAGRGKRMFTRDDARLTDRVVEQLRRAVAYDKAVERGRTEERTRIAQDLHDDIGARLLTLMYKSQTPEIEDYIRQTLKDLKTLTRGLASSDQRLSHATAEWKSDIGQRLTAAQIELAWSFNYDRDVVLSVVQWSALTRVLRELVSNTIQHSCATHVDIAAALDSGRLRLCFGDDGIGRNPKTWAHGLGLSGVRKRVKLLGGDVQWTENGHIGIACTVLIPDLHARQ